MKSYINFIYEKNKEKIIYITSKGDIKPIQLKLWEDSIEDTLGSCFCSILNTRKNIDNAKKLFNKDFSKITIDEKRVVSGIQYIMKFAFSLLLDSSPFFIILYDDLFNATVGALPLGLKRDEINNFCRETKIRINNIFDKIIASIDTFDNFYSKKTVIDKIYLPPSVISAVNGKVSNTIQECSYKIYTLDELLGVSFYLLTINNYHVKRCKYPECNKYFSSSDGRIKRCNNPCPYNTSKPCIEVELRRTPDYTEHSQEEWEKEFDFIEKDYRNSNQFLYDHIKKSKNQREKNMLNINKNKLQKNVANFRNLIKGATDEEKRQEYINNYKSFIKGVRDNQLSNPPIYKVKNFKFIHKYQ